MTSLVKKTPKPASFICSWLHTPTAQASDPKRRFFLFFFFVPACSLKRRGRGGGGGPSLLLLLRPDAQRAAVSFHRRCEQLSISSCLLHRGEISPHFYFLFLNPASGRDKFQIPPAPPPAAAQERKNLRLPAAHAPTRLASPRSSSDLGSSRGGEKLTSTFVKFFVFFKTRRGQTTTPHRPAPWHGDPVPFTPPASCALTSWSWGSPWSWLKSSKQWSTAG